MTHTPGFASRFSAFFLSSRLTPLLTVVCMLMGVFAFLVTPREEEPQMSVILADVMIPFPGAAVREVEQTVVNPAEQALSRMPGVDHIVSVARPGMALVTVQFKIGVTQTEALVRLHDTVNAHADWAPAGRGVLPPVIKVRDPDDMPALALTLYSRNPEATVADLERVAHSIETELKRVPGTRDVVTIGGPGRAVTVEIDPARLRAHGITVADLGRTLRTFNHALSVGELLLGNRAVALEAGAFLDNADEIGRLMVGVHDGKPVFMREVATLRDGPPPLRHHVWHGVGAGGIDSETGTSGGQREYPAVTISVTKQRGSSASAMVEALLQRTETLRNTVIPPDIEIAVARNVGTTADDMVHMLVKKLLLVTLSVVALIFFALGRREAGIVLFVIVFTLSATLFAAWAFGYTLNRASLLALVVSIGILVDDAVVVIENIHRHQILEPNRPLLELIPLAIGEIGGPTILATFTVIAALMPMAFVEGLQGEYFRPIPVITSLGMLMSLLIALAVTPWLSARWMQPPADSGAPSPVAERLAPLFTRCFAPLLHDTRGRHYRAVLGLAIIAATIVALSLPFLRIVDFNLQPPDNRIEFSVVLDMPPDTPLEQTAAVLQEMSAYIARQPEVRDYQVYAGTAAPVSMSGLVRQYYLRGGGEQGEIQVNLIDKAKRKVKSHDIVVRLRPEITRIAQRHNATVKVFDPPPGTPQLAPIVAEIHGPTQEGRFQVAKAVRGAFERTAGIVDVSDSSVVRAPKTVLLIDRGKSARLGITQQDIIETLRAGMSGEGVTYLHDASRHAAPVILQLAAERHSDLAELMQLSVRGADGQLVPLRELITLSNAEREQPIMHKDLLPVHLVLGDFDTSISSPLLGLYRIRQHFDAIVTPGGGRIVEYFRHQPLEHLREYGLKWDGEWRVTYETFRDLGIAYLVGLVLIYLLIVSQFSSYTTPLIIMVPIPFTLIGLMFGHAVTGTQLTVTSMVGLMVLAGLLVRNSILLVDFIQVRVAEGMPLKEAVVLSANIRAQPILLTSLSAAVAALFLLDDTLFNGLAIALIFGNMVSTSLTLVVIPTLYYALHRNKYVASALLAHPEASSPGRDQ